MESNFFWCLIGALLSLTISYFFYFLSKTRKRISYNIQTSCLISNDISNISNLVIELNNKKITELYTSKIELKNVGNSIIEKKDFSNYTPLSINLSPTDSLNDNIENQIYFDKNNNVDCYFKKISYSRLLINFDYIPKKGTICFTIYHTNKRIYIQGTLKDGSITRKKAISKLKIFIFTIIMLFSFAFGWNLRNINNLLQQVIVNFIR